MNAQMNDASMPATKGDLQTVKAGLQTDLQTIKEGLQAYIQEVKRDLSARLNGHDQRFDRIEDNLHRVNVGYAQMKGDLWDFRAEFRQALEAQSALLLGRMDRILDVVEGSKLSWAFHEDRLQRHDARIKRLESRRQ